MISPVLSLQLFKTNISNSLQISCKKFAALQIMIVLTSRITKKPKIINILYHFVTKKKIVEKIFLQFRSM